MPEDNKVILEDRQGEAHDGDSSENLINTKKALHRKLWLSNEFLG